MWSRRGILLSLLLAGAVAPLAGCGFRPLYGRYNADAGGTSVNHQMAGIRISAIGERDGQMLHNALRDRFNPMGQPASSDYSLDVGLTTRTYGALTRSDLSATRRNVEMTAAYSLRDLSGAVVMTDKAMITTGYDEFDDPLNDISSLEDAQRRGTFQLADQIRTRVAVFLTAGTPAPNVPPQGPVPQPVGAWSTP